MSALRSKNLKKLFVFSKEIPVTTEKLKKVGISSSLARKYKESEWIESIGTGAFKFPGSSLTIEGLLHALQEDLALNIYAGAKTALELAGVRHYYREMEKKYLFTDRKTNLPLWVKHYQWGGDLRLIRSSKWNRETFLFSPGTKDFDFYIASKELAILQQIELINRGESFLETARLFEILDSLNVDLVNEMLREASVKTKRIILFLTDFYDHPWKTSLNRDIIMPLNSVITIEKGGKYLKDYRLVIPGGFDV